LGRIGINAPIDMPCTPLSLYQEQLAHPAAKLLENLALVEIGIAL
jgi:hypothetical protein